MGGGEHRPSSSPTSTSTSTSSSSSPPAPASLLLPMRILTHNIRYATHHPFHGERPWSDRLPLLTAQLAYHSRVGLHNSTIIFVQEALQHQLTSLLSALSSSSRSKTYRSVGRPRDDGVRYGEYSAILFDESVWEVVDGSEETVWLNPTGEVGKKGWDAACVRVVTCVVLRYRCATPGKGKQILCLNTHLDDQGAVSRRMSAKIILREMRARRERFHVDAVIVGGDLNSEADEGGGAYQVLAGNGEAVENSDLVDVRIEVRTKHGNGAIYGDRNTFTGFNGGGDGEGKKRIDFLFMGRSEIAEGGGGVVGYAVLPNRFEDGVYLSDHRAVVADILI